MIQIELERPDCGHITDYSKINELFVECKPVVVNQIVELDEKIEEQQSIDELKTFEEKASYINQVFNKNLKNIHSEFLVGKENELVLKIADTYKKIEMELKNDEKFSEFFLKFCENQQYVSVIDNFNKSILSMIVDSDYKNKYIDRFGNLRDGVFNWLKRLNKNKSDIIIISLYVLSGGIFCIIKSLI